MCMASCLMGRDGLWMGRSLGTELGLDYGMGGVLDLGECFGRYLLWTVCPDLGVGWVFVV